MKSNQQKSNNKRHTAGIIMMLLICTVMTAIGCHRSSDDIPSNVTVVSVTPTPTPTAEPTDIPTPVTEPTDKLTAVPTSTPTPSAEPTIAPDLTPSLEPTGVTKPTATTAPTGEEYLSTPTPTQVPYEGFVIGKDVNNNELKMTSEEADEFVMAGNILKLYDGSWFDIDDDGEPEYVSIQPYGHWEWSEVDYREIFVVDGQERSFRYPPLRIISITGYNDLYLSDYRSGYYVEDTGDKHYVEDECVYITSLDGVSKQLIIRATVFYGEWTENYPYVYRIEGKRFTGCGCLGSEIKDFRLKGDKTYDAEIDVIETALGGYTINSVNHFDGEKIIADIGDQIAVSIYEDPLTIIADQIEFFTYINGEREYVTLSRGDRVSFLGIEIISTGRLEGIWNTRYLTDDSANWYTDSSAKRYDIRAELAETDFLLHFFDVENQRELWVEEKNGRLYSEQSGQISPWYFQWYVVGD